MVESTPWYAGTRCRTFRKKKIATLCVAVTLIRRFYAQRQ